MILEKDNLLDQSKLNNLKFFLIFLNLFLSLIQLHLNEFKISFLIIILFLNIINIIICNIIFNKENLYFFFISMYYFIFF